MQSTMMDSSYLHLREESDLSGVPAYPAHRVDHQNQMCVVFQLRLFQGSVIYTKFASWLRSKVTIG